MGEGIYIHGTRNARRSYTRDLQSFAKKVVNGGRENGSYYDFGLLSKKILNDLARRGIEVKTEHAAITDRVIRKYLHHPKRTKGAVVSFNRFRMVEHAVKHPKNVYIDKKRKRLIYVSDIKYDEKRVLKVVIEPNQRVGKKYYHTIVSIGVVKREDMNDGNIFEKIKK